MTPVDPSDTVSEKTNSRVVLEHRSQLSRGWTSGCVVHHQDQKVGGRRTEPGGAAVSLVLRTVFANVDVEESRDLD